MFSTGKGISLLSSLILNHPLGSAGEGRVRPLPKELGGQRVMTYERVIKAAFNVSNLY